MEHISVIPDYRQAWKVEHKLSDILLLTICAVISGAEGWEDIEDFGETHLDFLKQYGDFENGIPVHDTIARVVSCKMASESIMVWHLNRSRLASISDHSLASQSITIWHASDH
ncbi:transposase [Escherichia coli]|nr:transposase [Escherichia coli]